VVHQAHHNTVWVLATGRDSGIAVNAEDDYHAIVVETAALALPAVGGSDRTPTTLLAIAVTVIGAGVIAKRLAPNNKGTEFA